jgi:hypothetical protein
MHKPMTRGARILIGAIALLALPAVAQSEERGRDAKGDDWSYDYNVPLALPPYGYTPGFWGYGGKRHYDKFGNYRKYQQPGGPYDGPVETKPLPGSLR